MTYLEPWHAVGAEARRLQAELAAELGRRHRLHGLDMRAVARRQDNDDVLFVSADEPQTVAVVHLTWSGRREADPRWPDTTLFGSLEDWAERGMMADHRDFIGVEER